MGFGTPYVDRGRLRAFLKTLYEKGGELLSLSRNQLRIMTGVPKGHCHLKGFSHIKNQEPGLSFMQSDDFEDISMSRMQHFVQGVGLLDA
jgi:hypothetical protein